MKVLANYHTHNFRCKHAEGDVADYAKAAVAKGLEVLGISDHTPLPDGRWSGIRMTMAELPDYCRAIDAARAAFPELVILKAAECEWDAPYDGWYREALLGQREFDYLIGAVHWFPHEGEWLRIFDPISGDGLLRSYTRHFIRTMRAGIFTFMAHPDAFGLFHRKWDAEAEACAREMLAAASDLGVFLEINALGLRRPMIDTPDGPRHIYPLEKFWEIASEFDVRVVANSDAHRPDDLAGKLVDAWRIADRYGLKRADLSHLVAA